MVWSNAAINRMLELRTYTRKELVDIYKTQSLAAIKKKISRDGYKYQDNGRGASYTIEVKEIPKGIEFKEYCINRLGFAPQTDFSKLRMLLRNIIYDDAFLLLPFNQMKERLREQGITIDVTTLSKYIKQLEGVGLVYRHPDEYIYYVYCDEMKRSVEMTHDEYSEMYRIFYEHAKRDNWDFHNAEIEIRMKYGGKPRKRRKLDKSAFYKCDYEKIQYLIDEEINL